MSSSLFLSGSLRSSAFAGMSISKVPTPTWIARLVTMLREDGAPNVLNMLFPSMVVTRPSSLDGNKLDLQIIDARLREIDDAQNAFVVHAIVGSQEEHALFRRLSAQGVRHARGQFRRWDLLITQHHVTIRRDAFPCRRLEY